MIKRIHHIAVAVRSVDQAAENYRRFYGLEFGPAEDVPAASIRTRTADLGGVALELVQPLKEGDAISSHLERKGEGLYLLSLAVDSISAAAEQIDKESGKIIARQTSPTTGAELLMTHPRENHGVLVQLVQEGIARV